MNYKYVTINFMLCLLYVSALSGRFLVTSLPTVYQLVFLSFVKGCLIVTITIDQHLHRLNGAIVIINIGYKTNKNTYALTPKFVCVGLNISLLTMANTGYF